MPSAHWPRRKAAHTTPCGCAGMVGKGGCYFSGVDSTRGTRYCPIKANYDCLCQHPDPAHQPLWLPRDEAKTKCVRTNSAGQVEWNIWDPPWRLHPLLSL